MAIDTYSKTQMIALGITFLILPCIFVNLRVWAKWVSRGGVQWDDYLIFGALAFSVACSITQLIGAIDGQLGQHQTTGADGEPLLNDPRFLTYEKCKFASQLMAVIGLGLTKLSLLVLLRGIFSISRVFNHVSAALLGITGVWTISFFFSNLFTCYPITPLVEPFYGNKCIDSVSMWYASCITDVIIDVFILVLPLPLVFKLRLPMKQRLAVAGMFIMGAAVIAISITRMAMYFHVGTTFMEHYNDETYYTSPVFFWTNIEISLAVILACLPTLRPLWIVIRGRPVTFGSKSYEPYSSSRQSGRSARNHKRIPDTVNELDTINLVERYPEV
ncbi:hypothetical protein BDV32DRAFT_146153 [Aspergillus pseudonomiae]|uniref:Rhodopsin domain-containing protein n=1 Tax=Aspergillus pseudonomiae TaxID=1506151 RepID=A0A5N6IDI3_9EURO|nr:uncharacterized protein BDV37DRAFT_282107 [Aspergillus pseudonomiae]KAB8263850.1 hypothetical protein BDV32DRAFT_146153 [Aspergillus pseudonomiae]KAE8405153.1 hypothetical protein BDV37DRAFT_282107 [Aspergillus pseudonomiae]